MAKPGQDPLQYGNPAEDMDDLTAQLESAMRTFSRTRASSMEDYDLGDLPSPAAPSLDRYRAMAHDSSDPLGTGSTNNQMDHPSLSYGQLVTPSAHEDQRYNASHYTPSKHTSSSGAAGEATSSNGRQYASSSQQVQYAGEGSTPAPTAGSVATAKAAPMTFTVTDPVKREQTGLFGLKGGHVTYLVTTNMRTQMANYTRGQTFSVRRRFRDFVSLAAILKVRFRGYFLPPRPEKNAVEGQRMSDTFVEDRRAALERYINRLAQHPVVSASQELRVFVETPEELDTCLAWVSLQPSPSVGLVESTTRFSKQLLGLEQTVLDPSQAIQPTSKASDPMRAIRETAQLMSNNSAAGPSLPEGELELRHERELMEAKRDALVVATRAAERFVHRMDRLSSVYGDTGLAFFKISKFEEAEGPHMAQFTGTVRQAQALATTTKLTATSLVRIARLVRRTVGKSASELSALHDQLASMTPAIKGLTTREKQLLTADTLEADVESRQRAIRDLEIVGSRVAGGDPAKARRAEELRGDIAKLQSSIAAAKAEYARIGSINRIELVRAIADFQVDMQQMVLSFTASQALSAQRLAEVWLQLAGELQSNPEQLAELRNSVIESQQTSPSADAGQPLPTYTRMSQNGAGSTSGRYSGSGAAPSQNLMDM